MDDSAKEMEDCRDARLKVRSPYNSPLQSANNPFHPAGSVWYTNQRKFLRNDKPYSLSNPMNRTTRTRALLTGFIAVALCGTARADLVFSTSPTVSSYLGSPIYTSVAASGATTAQGNPALGAGSST